MTSTLVIPDGAEALPEGVKKKILFYVACSNIPKLRVLKAGPLVHAEHYMRVNSAMVLKEPRVAGNVVGQKIQNMNKSISIKIENDEAFQKEVFYNMQQPTRNHQGRRVRI